MKLNPLMQQVAQFGKTSAAGKPGAPLAAAPQKQAAPSNPLANFAAQMKGHNLNKPALPHTASGKLNLFA